MPKVKSLLKRSTTEQAQKKRTCKHIGSTILSGQQCLVVYDGPRQRFCYCADVALKMIVEARLELDRLEESLNKLA